MEIIVNPESIKYEHGLGISVPGYDGSSDMDADNPCQFYIEISKDSNELKLYYWNNSHDPEVIVFKRK